MSEIVCRRPDPDEAEAVCAVFRRIVTTSFPGFPREAVVAYLEPWTTGQLRARLEGGQGVMIAAFAGTETVGLVSGAPPEAGVGTVAWLLVDADWRGRRVGQALYGAACDAYRSLGAHKMKLTAPSERAARFYERCGMRVEGFHPAHWYRADFFALGVQLSSSA